MFLNLTKWSINQIFSKKKKKDGREKIYLPHKKVQLLAHSKNIYDYIA